MSSLFHNFQGAIAMKTVAVVVFALTLSALTLSVSAQTNPLPLGSVSNVQPMSTCPSGYVNGAVCSTATISCPNLANIGVTFGTTGIPKSGTIIFLNGNGGTGPMGSQFASGYMKAGFSLVQVAFAFNWENGNGNLLQAACRPATLLDYFHPAPTIPYGVQATSAGSGAVAYAFAWYGLAGEFKNAEFTSGPVFSNIGMGCEVPYAPTVTVTPTNGMSFPDNPQYNTEYSLLTKWAGQPCLPTNGNSTQAQLDAWAAESIVQPGATLAYPGTTIAMWDCDNGLNPSATQSFLFLSSVVTPLTLTRISNCAGAEGVGVGLTPQGIQGSVAISNDMITAMTQVR